MQRFKDSLHEDDDGDDDDGDEGLAIDVGFKRGRRGSRPLSPAPALTGSAQLPKV
jgi:hypothetical protein